MYKCAQMKPNNYNDNAVVAVDPDTGAHTQNTESTWWQIKRSLPATNSRHDGGLLMMFGEFLYIQEPHFFLTYLKQCAQLYPPK